MQKITSNASFKTAMRLGVLMLLAAPTLSACSGGVPDFINSSTKFATSKFGKASPRVSSSRHIKKGGGREMIGKPYQVAGRWYKPEYNPNYDKTGAASWYGPNFHGRQTANGEVFDQFAITAAHPTLPLPSYVRVTNLENNRSMVVRVNDRGPFVSDREIDLSRRAAELLGYQGKGVARVRVKYVGPAPTEGDDTRMLMASLTGPTQMERGHASTTRIAQIETERPRQRLAPVTPQIFTAPTPEVRSAPRGNVLVTAEGFNLVAPQSGTSAGLGALFYGPQAQQQAGIALNEAFEATEAMALNPGQLHAWQQGMDDDTRAVHINLGVFKDATNAANVLTAFALIGAVDEDDVQLANSHATRLTLSHLKPGVTRADVVSRAASLGLEVQFMYD